MLRLQRDIPRPLGSYDEINFIRMTWHNSVGSTQPLKIRGFTDGNKPLRSLPRSATRVELVREPRIKQALRQMLQIDPRLALGTGADMKTPWPDIPVEKRRLQLVKAWKLFDESQTQVYEGGRRRVQRDCEELPIARSSRWTTHDVRGELWQAILAVKVPLEPEINETLLLTGVPKDVVRKILRNGLNERFSGSNAGSMFGAGNYFAEDAGKCDHYTTPDQKYNGSDDLHTLLYPDGDADFPAEEVFYMFVAKVCLGHCAQTDNCPHDRMCKRTGTTENVFATRQRRELAPVSGSDTVHFHSLLAHIPTMRYREFINFNAQYTHLEFLMAYSRTGDR